MFHMNLLESLRAAVSGIRVVEGLEPCPIPRHSVEYYGMGFGYIHWRLGRLEGFTPEGSYALRSFVTGCIAQDAKLKRGVTHKNIYEKAGDLILSTFLGRNGEGITSSDVAFIEAQMMLWLRQQICDFQHYIPCRIMPVRAEPFEIGPVIFTHKDDFEFPDHEEFTDGFALLKGSLTRTIQNDRADWIAYVKTYDCDQDRAQEIGDLVVDLALSVIQVIVHRRYSANMARVSARTLPVNREIMMTSNKGVHGGGTNQAPGLGVTKERFESVLNVNRSQLASMGRRITAFSDGTVLSDVLECSWCDAAYWHHQAIAEPIDSIALIKLEAAIESLFAPGGSSQRLREGFAAFFGWKGDHVIGTYSPITVNQLVTNMIVEPRSRFLHGDQSILSHSLILSLPDITEIVANLLALFAIKLDAYKASGFYRNDLKDFLKYVTNETPSVSQSP